MIKKCLLIVSLFVLVAPSMLFAAEAFNAYEVRMANSPKVVDVVITWTTDGAGAFTAVALSTKEPFDEGYPVYVQFCYTNPLGTGPTDDYDLSFVSSELSGVDVFGQAFYDRDTLNPETKEPEIAYVRMSDNAKLQVAKETSEGVRNSLNVLIADDRVDDAKDMLENYKNHLTPADRVALQKKLTTSERKTEANTFLNSMGGLSSAEQLKRIEGIKDFELKQEVMNKKHSYDTKMEDYRKRKMKANDDVLLNTILDRQNSDQPFYGVSDMQDDKTFKAVYDNASPKAKQAAIEMFNAPKESKPEALANVQSLFLGSGEGIDKLSPTEFQQKIVGLSKTDKTKYTNMYMNMRTETQGEQRATYRVAGKMLQDQLLLNEHIKRNGFNKIAGDDELELIRANDALFEHLSDRPDIRGDDTKLKEFVKQYSASLAKGKVFKPAAPATVQQKSSTTKPTTGNVTLPTGPELTALKKAYKGKYGSFPAYPGKDEDALKSFFKTR